MKKLKLKMMVIGAHPDDCDLLFGGTALKFLALGHEVMFLSATNGGSGHHETMGVPLVARRYAETQAVAKLTGIQYKMLDIPDAFLTTDLRYREMVIREIRNFAPDVIFTHRSTDYHPDHRNAGLLVQDASYLLMVPNVVPDCPVLRYCPVIMYLEDNFTLPRPFRPDVIIGVDDVILKKRDMAHCHTSQVYEWLPWVDGYADTVPPAEDEEARREWMLQRTLVRDGNVANRFRDALKARYGEEAGEQIKCAEAFELCEYGGSADAAKLKELFPF